jgi:DNA-binding XRE family transcriptional regulator
MGKAKNKHIGSSVGDWLSDEGARDPGFTAEVEAQVDRLELARKVRRMREDAGLTQAQLAARVGTKQPGIARVERGRSVASLELLHRIAAATGHTLRVSFGVRKQGVHGDGQRPAHAM